MRYFLLLLALLLATRPAHATEPTVRIKLTANPTTHVFTCRYSFTLAAGDTAAAIRLLLPRQFALQRGQGTQGQPAVTRRYYPYFADTLQQVTARFPARSRRPKALTLTYTGQLDKALATAQVMEFSGHSQWLPFRPGREYELVAYTLDVRVPPAWQVRSTRAPRRARAGRYQFRGVTSAIEPTAIVAQQVQQLHSKQGAAIEVLKVGATTTAPDTALLRRAADIVHFYNRTLGRQDSIGHFRLLLTGTNQSAFGLLDNATAIPYREFNVADRADLLILAHEISHKWWSYGSVHNENDWLNEAFATYSSLLYLQARGDTAGYRAEYAKRASTAVGTPAIIRFDRFQHPYAMYRRVIYNKGTVVLAALHQRVGTARLYAILADAAAQKASTTEQFLAIVARQTDPATRAWLLAELSR